MQIQEIFPFVFPFIFIGAFVIGSWTLSRTSGWATLGEIYPFEGKFEGKVLTGRYASFGALSNYNGCVTLGASPEGLYLNMIFFFRVGHKPLLIPWKDIKTSEQQFWFRTWVTLEISQAPGVTLRLRKKDVLRLKEESGYFEAFPDVQA